MVLVRKYYLIIRVNTMLLGVRFYCRILKDDDITP